MKNYYDHYTERAVQGYDDDQDLVDAICVAHDAMPALLPAAFAACIEQEEREVLAQSIELELQRAKRQKEQEEHERLQAEQKERERERERIELELREAEHLQANQPPQVNAADISRLMIDRMAELAETPQPDNELYDSLKRSLKSFFDDTTSIDREYLRRAATDFVSQMRDAEVQRIQRLEPDKRAAMSLIKRVGKIMSCLPSAIEQTLQVVNFISEAPPIRELPEDEAEFEEDVEQDEEEPQGLPASGTPPGPPPPWDPRENPSTLRTGRVQEAVQRIEGPQLAAPPSSTVGEEGAQALSLQRFKGSEDSIS